MNKLASFSKKRTVYWIAGGCGLLLVLLEWSSIWSSMLPLSEPSQRVSARLPMQLTLIEKSGDELRSLPLGKIVLRAPANMKVGEVRRVDANVGIDVPEAELQKNVRPVDQKVEGIARLSALMAAALVGETFKITLLTPEQQSISAGFPTVWSWNVEATEQGDKVLEATLYAMLPDRRRVDSYMQNIHVDVRPATWGERIEAFGREFDVAKSVVVALFGLATVVGGWFGVSFVFRAKKSAPAEVRNPPSD
jgi:hypothetical protein